MAYRGTVSFGRVEIFFKGGGGMKKLAGTGRGEGMGGSLGDRRHN